MRSCFCPRPSSRWWNHVVAACCFCRCLLGDETRRNPIDLFLCWCLSHTVGVVSCLAQPLESFFSGHASQSCYQDPKVDVLPPTSVRRHSFEIELRVKINSLGISEGGLAPASICSFGLSSVECSGGGVVVDAIQWYKISLAGGSQHPLRFPIFRCVHTISPPPPLPSSACRNSPPAA